jgi:ATP-dependent RNA helicase DHX8/PRP22
MDDRPVPYKIYTGRVSGLKEFGAFVTLEGVSGRTEGMVHVSNIQAGARTNSASDLLTRGQIVKVKVMSVAGSRVGLSMKDVDQVSGRDLTPHLRIKSEAEMEAERREAARSSISGSNAIPLRASTDEPTRSAKRLTSPERWEIKQLISSGMVDASEYPDLDEDFNNPTARAEVEEELDVEVREEEPPFLAGQTKKTLDLSPVKIVKAPDGSLNRAALSGAALAKERREMRQQEANEQADSEARDFSTPWLDPMSQQADKVFAQDLRGNVRGQGETPKWRQATFNKATTFGEITKLSIQDQRKNLPIYKLRDPLLQAIREVCLFYILVLPSTHPITASSAHRSW